MMSEVEYWVDKCDNCPLDEPTEQFSPNDWNGGNFYTEHGCKRIDDCHLTPDHKRFIDAMIRGVFDCGHCNKFTREDCVVDYAKFIIGTEFPCGEDWQERKEGEDGEV